MDNTDRKNHWENIYQSKSMNEVSWYQPTPKTSLLFLEQFNLPKDAAIIDIGGGDSFLVDVLLELGYTNISVLDISEAALQRAKNRLGDNASKVKWIVSDASEFNPKNKYDFWHDRAAFHFLTNEQQITKYRDIAEKAMNENGILVIGTFSETGPKKCSGLEIKQYSEATITNTFQKSFRKINCINVEHKTPFDTV